MIVGLGLDLVSAARIARALAAHGSRFEARVFTEVERQECAGRLDRAQALAARFAAQEACVNALGTGWSAGVSCRQVEVLRSSGGAPTLRLGGRAAEGARARGARRYHITLTHHDDVAAATVVLEG